MRNTLKTPPSTKEYREGWERIFKVAEKKAKKDGKVKGFPKPAEDKK